MKTNIRVLLLILTLLFLGTALTIRHTVTDTDILELDTKYLNKNLLKKENLVNEIFSDSLLLKTFDNSENYPLHVKDIAKKYLDQHVYLYIYKNNTPIFWATNSYVPTKLSTFSKQTSYIQEENSSYVAKEKELSNGKKLLALIPIEQEFISLKNSKKKKLLDYLQADNIEIAQFSDSENIRNIYSPDDSLLFSVKLKSGKHDNIYIRLQLLCWFFASICFIIIVTNICHHLAKRKKPLKSILLLGITLFLIRIFDLETNWISSLSNLDIFLPEKYSYNYFSPNIWAYLINTLSIFWLIVYTLSIKKYIKVSNKLKHPVLSILIYYILLSFLYIFYTYIFDQLATLITYSSDYQKDLAKFLYSNSLIYIHIIIYSISIVSLILLTDFILRIVEQLNLKNITALNIQLVVLIQFIIIFSTSGNLSIISILIGILIMARLFDNIVSPEINKYIHVVTLIIIALITNIKFSEANKQTLLEQMKITISAIQSEDDIQAISNFKKLEKDILQDKQLKLLLGYAKRHENDEIINEYIRKKYLNDYISKYHFKGYYFENDIPLGNYNSQIIDIFREKVIGQSIKVDETDLFYKSQITGIGIYEYFSIIRIPISYNTNATLILDFTNKNSNDIIYNLTGGKSVLTNFQNSNEDSYAIYRGNNLVAQKGSYIYSNRDRNIPKVKNEFIKYDSQDGYYHLIYRNNEDETIIVSKPDQPYWQFIAFTSVIFLLLYVLSFLTKLVLHIIPRYSKREFRLRYLNYQIREIYNTIRYSTRIQTLVISSVLVAILISGLITFFSIRIQTKQTRENTRLKYIAEVANKLELKILTENNNDQISHLQELMKSIADVVVTDFNLFDNSGKLVYTTQPKIFEQNFLSIYMNPTAFIELNVLKKTETHNEVVMANYSYESIYATIKNSNYNTVAYLGIPYYDSQEIDLESRDILLNTIFNIYTIIIIVFAFLSLYIANKITEPLQLIRKKLSTTNLNDKLNEPLYWKKKDEIGLLIKDYNYMLIKLEENAKQLRNAERESAWREMAKQVAHEIKNPLTPMKLGIQHLRRSFNENDPRMKERFEKITRSFIEQIDALAHIANEFSTFAKLPDTRLIPIDVNKEINESIETFKHSTNTTIDFKNLTGIDLLIILGDRDQALRAFNNLLKNAIEATSVKRKHQISIRIEKIDVDWIKISVKDNGDGIPHELRSNIFKPNFTTKSSGTGLGLAFVKQTVDAMGGRIYYESHINVGTTFFIELPIYKENKTLQ